MKEYKTETIQKTVNEINRSIVLPDIQRPFVWEEEKIYKLFDSLMRGYPISTFLYWDLDRDKVEELDIKMYYFVESNEADSKLIVNRDKDKYSLVLDGQQRLTSLYIALKGTWMEKVRNSVLVKELYFNVLTGDNEDENGIRYEFCFLPKQYGLSYAGRENNEDAGAGVKLWVNVKKIFESDLGKSQKRKTFVQKIIENNKDLSVFENKIDDNIDTFDDVLKDNGVINYFSEGEHDYERVLDIFVRTNAGGTKLSYSDLLFSRIKYHWNSAREEFSSVIREINKRNYEFDADFILKTCLMIFSTGADGIRYNNIRNLNKDLVANIRTDWGRISGSIKTAIDLLETFLITDNKMLSSYNVLIPIVYWIYKKERDVEKYRSDNDTHMKELSVMRVWLTKALFSGVFGGQADNILFKCKEAIGDASATVFPAEAIQEKILETKSKSMAIREDKFDQIRYGSKESYLFLSLCYKGAINFQPIMKGNSPEQDHIFSKKELEDAGVAPEKINSIYNIRYVRLSDNRSKSKTPFLVWASGLKDRKGVFETHFIPDKDWLVSDFDDFIIKRKALLLANLQY